MFFSPLFWRRSRFWRPRRNPAHRVGTSRSGSVASSGAGSTEFCQNPSRGRPLSGPTPRDRTSCRPWTAPLVAAASLQRRISSAPRPRRRSNKDRARVKNTYFSTFGPGLIVHPLGRGKASIIQSLRQFHPLVLHWDSKLRVLQNSGGSRSRAHASSRNHRMQCALQYGASSPPPAGEQLAAAVGSDGGDQRISSPLALSLCVCTCT